MVIKHIVLSGGGSGGYAIYGALKYLSKENFWNINDIESIYATSIGAMLGIFIALKYDWDSLDDYLIKRPWDKIINIKPDDIIDAWTEKGIFKEDVIQKMINPLLLAKELSETITILEFYEFTKVDLHIFTTNISESVLKEVDMNYKTHPNLELYKAIAMSCAVPILFSPIYYDNNYYIDGGLLNNFPLQTCLNHRYNKNEIMAIRINSKNINNYIDISNSNLITYTIGLIEGMRRYITKEYMINDISNIILCKIENNSMTTWKDGLTNPEIRKSLINIGINDAKEFLKEMDLPEGINPTMDETLL
jgi:predicted acylesterase/phospholipase RssA